MGLSVYQLTLLRVIRIMSKIMLHSGAKQIEVENKTLKADGVLNSTATTTQEITIWVLIQAKQVRTLLSRAQLLLLRHLRM